MPANVDSAPMVTGSATSARATYTITVEAVPLATLPVSIMPAARSGGIDKARAIARVASGMMP